ncbi:MAG: anti-sigma factor family protein [Rhodothermales bacterium]
MSHNSHIDHLLQEYLDGTLTPEQQQTVDAHLHVCEPCRAEMEALASVMAAVDALPRSIEPPRDLWPEIETRLSAPLREGALNALERRKNGTPDRSPQARPPYRVRRLSFSARRAVVLAATVVLLAGSYWVAARLLSPAWDVTPLAGNPRIGEDQLVETGRIHRGEWLITDADSRASLDIGAIGTVEVEPNTRLRLLTARPTDHRLALETGTIHAQIWAPPRLFFVETPSALAIDMGCAYTLQVDSTGGSLLHVTSGYVALEHGERTSVVPAGSMCLTRPGHGPGTPFDEEASDAFRQALIQLDFEDGGAGALSVLLAEARAVDAITLWQLMYQVNPNDRGRLYDRLVELVPPPEGTTRAGVLRGDLDSVEGWDIYLGLDIDNGWFLKRLKKKTGTSNRKPL